jgi:hypothetical protein
MQITVHKNWHSRYEICSIIFVAATGYHHQNTKKVVKKLSTVVKKLSKSRQKVVKNCQKVVKIVVK